MNAKMTIPYRSDFWSAFGYGLAIAILLPLVAVLGFKAKQYGGALVCVSFAAIFCVGAWKRFSYGMHISEKRVVLRSQDETKVVPYDAVQEMVVTFTQANVVAHIKTEDEEIHFVWKDRMIDSRKTFPSIGWGYKSSAISYEEIRMTDRFVAKSIESLSRCEKVRIENLTEFS